MKNALLLAGRELNSYLRSPLGYIVAAALLLVDGILFYAMALGSSAGPRLSADVLNGFFYYTSGPLMIATVILSIRLVAGERETGTLVLLNTAPIKDREIVIGKFVSALAFITMVLACTIYMPLLIFVNGKVSWGHIAVGYLGHFLLASVCLSIGMFASSISRTQVIAAILGGVFLGVMLAIWLVARVTDPPINTFVSAVAIHHDRQRSFMSGVLKLENLVYYLTVSFFFLLAATKTLEARRWR